MRGRPLTPTRQLTVSPFPCPGSIGGAIDHLCRQPLRRSEPARFRSLRPGSAGRRAGDEGPTLNAYAPAHGLAFLLPRFDRRSDRPPNHPSASACRCPQHPRQSRNKISCTHPLRRLRSGRSLLHLLAGSRIQRMLSPSSPGRSPCRKIRFVSALTANDESETWDRSESMRTVRRSTRLAHERLRTIALLSM